MVGSKRLVARSSCWSCRVDRECICYDGCTTNRFSSYELHTNFIRTPTSSDGVRMTSELHPNSIRTPDPNSPSELPIQTPHPNSPSELLIRTPHPNSPSELPVRTPHQNETVQIRNGPNPKRSKSETVQIRNGLNPKRSKYKTVQIRNGP